MSEIKRRTKKDPPPAETETPPPRRERVTLTKDVSSRYRKLVPRAKAGGSAPSRPSRSKDQKTLAEPEGPPKPPPRRNNPGPGGDGPSEAVKAQFRQELPEAARQLRETQDLLRTTAEDILTLLEDWERLPHKEIKAARALVNALFEKMIFQDLAGQRLAKVENFLKTLDKIVQPASPADRLQPRRTKPPASKDKSLKGPQAAGGGLGQSEVETLLANLQGPPAPGPQGRRYRRK